LSHVSNNSITIPVDHQKEDEEDEEMIESTTTVNAGALSFEDILTMYYKDNTPSTTTMYIPHTTTVTPSSSVHISSIVYLKKKYKYTCTSILIT
jgi:hypothetical protein